MRINDDVNSHAGGLDIAVASGLREDKIDFTASRLHRDHPQAWLR